MNHTMIKHNHNMEEKMQCHYIDTDAFVLSFISRDIIKLSEHLDDLFHLSKLIQNHEMFSEGKTKK